MKRLRWYRRIVAWVVAAVMATGCGLAQHPDPAPSANTFHGFKSEEQLLDEFLAALTTKDETALDRLRVTEAEYRHVIIPGSAPVGRTMSAPLTEKKFNFFWSMLNKKSRDFAHVIIHDFGGYRWQRIRYWHTKEPQQLAGYRALGEVRIAVEDETGNRGTVRTGWVAEVAGQYKFIGFEYDD